MNILFIGPYRQFDSWGYKSRATLKALQNTSHTIISRPIFLSNNIQFNQYIEPSEQASINEYDIIIQYVLPPYTTYIGGAKNIGIFNYETIANGVSKDFLISETLMDELWTDNSLIQNGLEKSLQRYGINTKVTNVPTVIDLQLLPENPSQSFVRDNGSEDRFMFYCLLNPFDIKDGFKEICTAYLNSFTTNDKVALTIFTDQQVDPKKVTDLLDECKKSLGNRISPYDQPVIHVKMPEKNLWTMEDKVKMHIYGDSYISMSRSFCTDITTIESAIYQKNPIVMNDNAALEILTTDNLWVVDSFHDSCLYNTNPLPFRYTSKELWNRPNISKLSQTMKECFVNKRKRDKQASNNKKLRSKLSNISYEKYLKEKDDRC